MTSNEVHFDIPLTPIEDLALSRGCRIRQVRSNSLSRDNQGEKARQSG
jgi:hypothetical protein